MIFILFFYMINGQLNHNVKDYIVNFKGVEAMVCFFYLKKLCSTHENVLTIPNKVDALDTKFTDTYKQQTFEPYLVDGQVTGQYKNAGTFSYIRVYGAGHEVPAYKVRCVFFFCVYCSSLLISIKLMIYTPKFGNLAYGEAAAQIFTQIMRNESLSSTYSVKGHDSVASQAQAQFIFSESEN